ncbi:hypothetical protein GRF29_164g780217 [Pseudopithomyces chartarum]|uniref:Uncharacterized protein n=1 Tax=Pseudopithomyces chartarum TaxID=1892770 RepID=A0AAN6LPS2_9PLEO|nr:hypothetical protein GRF29_164g780217 [Pseudopithomyces chartarum]
MPPQRSGGIALGSQRISEATKGATVALRMVAKLPFTEIAGELQLPLSTPGNVYRLIEKRAEGHTIQQMLAAYKSRKITGRPRKKVVDNISRA